MPRVYERKFDWDKAREMRRQGMTYVAIAAEFGVTSTAIRFACDGRAYAIARSAASEYQSSGSCVDCGGRCGRNSTRPVLRCMECSAKHQATSVRDTELLCFSCREWKPDVSFPYNTAGKKNRRFRHGQCRECSTIARRAYRERNKVPCANGCGRLVMAANEQASSARQRGSEPTGMCQRCANQTKSQRRMMTA